MLSANKLPEPVLVEGAVLSTVCTRHKAEGENTGGRSSMAKPTLGLTNTLLQATLDVWLGEPGLVDLQPVSKQRAQVITLAVLVL